MPYVQATYDSITGFIVTPVDLTAPTAQGALLFRNDTFAMVIGGRTLADILNIGKPADLHELGTLAASYLRPLFFKWTDQPFTEVYAITTNVYDVYGAGTASNFICCAGVARSHIKNLGQQIDLFYSGMPHQGKSQMQSTIHKAKSQVLSYFNKIGVPLSMPTQQVIYLHFVATNPYWGLAPFFGGRTVEYNKWSPQRTGTLDNRKSVRYHLGQVKKSSIGRVMFDFTSYSDNGTPMFTKGDELRLGIEAWFSNKATNPGYSYTDALVSAEQANIGFSWGNQTGHSMVTMPVVKIFSRPIVEIFGGLAARDYDTSGIVERAGEDLSEDLFNQLSGPSSSTILDAEELVKQENETEAQFKARLEAAEAVTQARPTSVNSTLSSRLAFSQAFVIEICDRAIIGGTPFGGKTPYYIGLSSPVEFGDDYDSIRTKITPVFQKSH